MLNAEVQQPPGAHALGPQFSNSHFSNLPPGLFISYYIISTI